MLRGGTALISDEMLCIAAGEYEQALLASLPDADECYYSFSRKFEKKMRHLCHRVKYASAYSVMKRIACAIIVIILCGSMLLMLNTEVRAAVIGWIRETYKSFTSYFFVDEVENDEPLNYELTDLPEGYMLLDRMDTPDGGTVLYVSPEGKFVQLNYVFNTNESQLFIKSEDYDYSQICVAGQVMDVYLAHKPEDANAIVWTVEGRGLFQISAYGSKNEIVKLAQSVEAKKS